MAQKPSIPKGTRDFSPVEMSRRNYIFDTIKSVFQLYGFQQIETPSMENLSTLMGKYGEEGDKLLFKILNSGDFLSGTNKEQLANGESNKVVSQISEKGLRYDLTVPFARYVVQHQNEITFPFKRYQIQPVWRADRPQKGRYREFFQCDVDVVGSDSLINELELIQIVANVYKKLNINVVLKINNRKILSGIAEVLNASEHIIDITVAIDKFDKIGLDKVNEELLDKGITKEAINKLQPIILLSGSNQEKLESLRSILATSEIGLKGVAELTQLFEYVKGVGVELTIDLDLTLARGLNYYTGAIFEVKATDVQIGSITGGGRYDDLTGIFGLKDVSGVGISFGADRIYDVMEQLNLFPESSLQATKVLFSNFGATEEIHSLPIIKQFREAGIKSEIYPEAGKMKKQFGYADKKNIPFVVIIGEEEMAQNSITVKNMTTGEQESLTVADAIAQLR